MHSLIYIISKALEKLLIAMMIAIVATVSWQVFSRFILQSPSSYTEELARYLLIWIGLLGAAYAYKTRAHLGLDLLMEHVEGSRKVALKCIIEISVIVFAAAIMVFGGISLVSLTLELKQVSAALGIQMGVVYSVVPVSGCLIIIFAMQNLFSLNEEQGER